MLFMNRTNKKVEVFHAIIARMPRVLVLFEAHEDSMSEEPLLKEQTAHNTHTMTCHNTRGRTQAGAQADGRELLTLLHVRRRKAGAEKAPRFAVLITWTQLAGIFGAFGCYWNPIDNKNKLQRIDCPWRF